MTSAAAFALVALAASVGAVVGHLAVLLGFVARVLFVLAAASVCGDVVHVALHRFRRSRWRVLRALAALHTSHHEFLDEQLAFHDERFAKNVLLHQLPETALRLLFIGLVAGLFAASRLVVVAASCAVVVECVVVLARRGRDRFHPERRRLRVPSSRWFVDGDYHALHHAFPDHFVAAHVAVVDVVLGRMLPLARRVVVVTGASRFVAELQDELERAGARVVRVDEERLDDDILASASVLVLGHGAARRGDVAYESIVARARSVRGARGWPDQAPLDVWAIGDDTAWLARAPLWQGDDDVGLRLLVNASALGAARTLASLRRGARVV